MSSLPSASERVGQVRARHRAAGLRRVEVLVPEDKVDAVRAYAAQLREGSNAQRIEQARKLMAKAYGRFRASCLDNIDIDPARADLADAAIVAAALMNRGNAEAFKLGRQLHALAR